jgi:hypothetical protein
LKNSFNSTSRPKTNHTERDSDPISWQIRFYIGNKQILSGAKLGSFDEKSWVKYLMHVYFKLIVS